MISIAVISEARRNCSSNAEQLNQKKNGDRINYVLSSNNRHIRCGYETISLHTFPFDSYDFLTSTSIGFSQQVHTDHHVGAEEVNRSNTGRMLFTELEQFEV